MIPWSKGKALLWDATCVDTYAASHLSLSSVSAGAAASEAEVKKQNKYRSLSNGFNPYAPKYIISCSLRDAY